MVHTEPEFAEITPEIEKQLREFREKRKDDEIGGVGTRVLFEDDNVRIWEMTLEPGEWTDLHRHDHDYYLIVDSGDLVAGVVPEGLGPMDWFVGKIPEQGNTVFVPKGGTEWAYNIGKKRYHEVLIELKNT